MTARVSHLECGGLVFNAEFDSGNISRVEELDDNEFAVWTRSDCEGTPAETGFRTWFSFSVCGAERGQMLQFEVHNMNPQGKLFKQDMRPVWRALPSRPEWSRLQLSTSHTGTKEDDNFVLRFRHRCDCEPEETLCFAFCFPHSYADCMARYAQLDALFDLPPAAVLPPGEDGNHVCVAAAAAAAPVAPAAAAPMLPAWAAAMATCASGRCAPAVASLHATAAATAAAAAAPSTRPVGVYYHRELLARSLGGRRIDLITISGTNRMTEETEEPLGEGTMPEGGERPRRFEQKQVFIMTARVHPGEVPASHVLEGLVAFLLRPDDPRAKELRERFVFKLIPMLNPDGVYEGHYRADTRGVNLNRMYTNARPEEQPSIHAATQVVQQCHARGELLFYVDTHGHASKRGCFFYGNALPLEQQVGAVLFAKLVSLNSRWFDFNGCVFSLRNMYRPDKRDGLSKAGSGRVSVYRMTDLTFVYTLECNYNTGRFVNKLAPPHVPTKLEGAAALSPPPPPLRSLTPKYSPATWGDVGKAIAISVLDILGHNPATRLGPPSANGLQRMRSTVAAWVRTQAPVARAAWGWREEGAAPSAPVLSPACPRVPRPRSAPSCPCTPIGAQEEESEAA